jgi:hypothetical protein
MPGARPAFGVRLGAHVCSSTASLRDSVLAARFRLLAISRTDRDREGGSRSVRFALLGRSEVLRVAAVDLRVAAERRQLVQAGRDGGEDVGR